MMMTLNLEHREKRVSFDISGNSIDVIQCVRVCPTFVERERPRNPSSRVTVFIREKGDAG